MQFLDEIIQTIEDAILEDADSVITAGGIIKPGFHSEIDDKKEIIHDSEKWISQYQKDLIESTNIKNLRIKYTSAQGYFIEIPHSQSANILPDFIPRQSLTSVSRYTTDTLRTFESQLLAAYGELNDLEYSTFIDIRNSIKKHYRTIYNISRNISQIDFLSNGAFISALRSYSKPDISAGFSLKIIGGKHPVLSSGNVDFMSNALDLNPQEYIHVITGPNMGGKSTFLRQNALLILMAHMGYDIPCKSAQIPLTDNIFSRVGAGDNIYLGQSTFMVEMQEIAFILRHASKKSFIIIDEIGRGTSTYDGLALAWSILFYIQKQIGAKTLFATHYHEIIDAAEQLRGAKNYSVSVGENEENIVFLRKIVPGGIKKSYGIEVACLAGIPQGVIGEARRYVKNLELHQTNQQLHIPIENIQEDLIGINQEYFKKSQEVIESFKKLDLERISPLDCHKKMFEFQEKIKDL